MAEGAFCTCRRGGASFALVTGSARWPHATCPGGGSACCVGEGIGWDVEQEGLSGAPAIRILTGLEKHATILRAGRSCFGDGREAYYAGAGRCQGRVVKEALAAALKESSGPRLLWSCGLAM